MDILTNSKSRKPKSVSEIDLETDEQVSSVLDSFTAEDWSLLLNGSPVVSAETLRKITKFSDEMSGDLLTEQNLAMLGLDRGNSARAKKRREDMIYKGWFWEIIGNYSQKELQNLLHFWTGAPLLPFDTSKMEVKPQVTLRGKETNDARALLPTANTCINRLYLPRYNSKEVLETKLRIAIQVKSFGFV